MEETFCLWPENVPVFDIWMSLQTQWFTEMGIRTRLDYGAVDVAMRMRGVGKKDRSEFFTCIQAMERAALEAWQKAK